MGELQRTIPAGGTATVAALYYFEDAQNSVTVVPNGQGRSPSQNGTAAEMDSYDAWGQRRYTNGSDAGGTQITSAALRGYLDQYQMLSNNLVDLNARFYDANIGRFMSPDPLVGSNPDDLQDWNNYSYGGNNPMALSDPTGLCSGVFGCIGAFFSHIGHEISVFLRHNQTLNEILVITVNLSCDFATQGTGVAACAGAIQATDSILDGHKIGAALEAGAEAGAEAEAFNLVGANTGLPGPDGGAPGGSVPFGQSPTTYLENVAGHALVGGTFSVIQGGSFQSGALAAGFAASASPYIPSEIVEGTAASSVIGGVGSVLGGGKFGNGALTGAFSYLYNSCADNPQGCIYPGINPAQAMYLAYQNAEAAFASTISYFFGVSIEGTEVMGAAAQVGIAHSGDQGTQLYVSLSPAQAGSNAGVAGVAGAQIGPISGPAISGDVSTPYGGGGLITDTNLNPIGEFVQTPGKFGASGGVNFTCTYSFSSGATCH